MTTFALVVPCKNFIDVAFEVFEQHNAMVEEFSQEQYVMHEIIVTADTLHDVSIEADVIVTRGLIAQILKGVQADIPIIEVSVPASDILRSVNACRTRFGARKVGMIAAPNMLTGVNDLEGLTDMEIVSYQLNDTWNGPALVDRAIKDGCDAVMGGLATCRYASYINVNNMLLKTGRDSFWQAITAAKRMAAIRRTEQEKSTRMQIILDSAKEGFLSLDLGKRVRMINRGAARILGLSDSVLNAKIAEAPLPMELKRLLVGDAECTNEIVKCRDVMLAVNKQAIRVGRVVMGMVITCQEVGGIQSLEGDIRKKIYSKGHVAKARFADIIGDSPAMRRMVATAKKCARTDSNVLLMGMSGTGKEILAQSIHNHSDRENGPFVAVNCAAIPDSLLESELFGYAAGAFSGARKNGKPGFFELAHGGTIFLDEVGEIPPSIQVKLLRAIQEREVMRLGGESVLPVDIRVIAATNKNLEEQVRLGLFREDLFYRLDVLRINIPPLSERREDIPLLAARFLADNFPEAAFRDDALAALENHLWSGNVRQLFNICERLAILTDSGVITAADVAQALPETAPIAEAGTGSEAAPPPPAAEERARLAAALERTRYHRGRAAVLLGMNRSTLWRKMREYGLS